MKLISMTDFVLEQSEIVNESGDFLIFKRSFIKIENYANFLKQPLALWMFIPCDEDGNILENIFYPSSLSFSNDAELYRKKYQQAKERCLFEKSEYSKILITELYDVIEEIIKLNLQLTKTAIKQLGL